MPALHQDRGRRDVGVYVVDPPPYPACLKTNPCTVCYQLRLTPSLRATAVATLEAGLAGGRSNQGPGQLLRGLLHSRRATMHADGRTRFQHSNETTNRMLLHRTSAGRLNQLAPSAPS